MYFFPTVVIDNFLKDPLKVRDYALGFEFGKGPNFSGIRTTNLFNVNEYFADSVCKKVLYSCGLPYVKYKAEAHFHLTGQEFGYSGWPHTDFDDFNDTKFACVLYLNITPKGLDSGTSIFRINRFNNISKTFKAMRETFETGEDNKEVKEEALSNYEETIRVGGIFNRLIAYDSRQYHCGNDYFGSLKEDQRLTLLIFFKKIEFDTPNGHPPIVCADMMSCV